MSKSSASNVFIVGISSPSGGGKTATTRKTAELLKDSVAV
jgi:uridine kinase